MAEVIIWSTGEAMMSTAPDEHTQRPKISSCVALHSSPLFLFRVCAQRSFDLCRNGWLRMGQHNICCLETTEREVCKETASSSFSHLGTACKSSSHLVWLHSHQIWLAVNSAY